jgi:hypothetical protein
VGGLTIIRPNSKIIVESKTEEDEVIVADCDLDQCLLGKTRTFDFARHRRTEHYSILTAQTGVVKPLRLLELIHTRNIDNSMPNDPQIPSLQSVTGSSSAKQIRILLCNPNATLSITNACLDMLKPTLPPNVTVYGFTAPKPALLAIEGNFNNIMSAAATARAIILIAH